MQFVNIRCNLADYWHLLSSEEKDWLRKFESEYGGHTRLRGKHIHSPSQIREAYRRRHSKCRDVYHQRTIVSFSQIEESTETTKIEDHNEQF